MSGIEVAGLVLGAIPLVISALENYQAGKGAMATMFKFRGLFDKLIRQLRSEQVFFYTKILILLRETRVAEVGDTIDPTEEECIRILQDVRAGREIKDYLGQVYEPFMEILGHYEKCLKTIAAALGHLLRPKSVCPLPVHLGLSWPLCHLITYTTQTWDRQIKMTWPPLSRPTAIQTAG